MIPGRELDALVAEHVMGKKLPTTVCYFEGDPPSGPVNLCPFYSTDIAAAWEVVARLTEAHKNSQGYAPTFEIYSGRDDCDHQEWYAQFYNRYGSNNLYNCEDGIVLEKGRTPPHAICLAALKAVGYEGD